MSRFASRFSTRTKVIALAVAGLTLAAVPAAAGGWNHHYHGGYGYGGAVAAGVVGGLVLGGIAASAAPRYYEPRVLDRAPAARQQIRPGLFPRRRASAADR